MLRNLIIGVFSSLSVASFSQSDSTRSFELDLEFRPRFEYRDGYKSLTADTLKPASFISQRSRLNLNFTQKKFNFYFSAQDVRTFGQNGSSTANTSIGVFEAYASFPLGNQWNIIIGRQSVELDNGRLLSRANWNQFSLSHDGFSLNYKTTKLSNDFLFFYNQVGEPVFGNNYAPNFYKYLFVQFAEYQPTQTFEIKVLNIVDGYQGLNNPTAVYARATSGGRLEYQGKTIHATVSAYYQYGHDNTGRQISAYYAQPEIGFKKKKFGAQLGMEYVSGDDAANPSSINNSFSTLYGVAFKFMGHMDYFTSFPNDVRGAGLINPYLFLEYKLSKKWWFKLESHAFLLQNTLYDMAGSELNPYLGIESDVVIKYTISNEMFFDFGLSAMSASSTMGEIKTGDFRKTPVYSYFMFTWKPTLLRFQQPIN